jgi:hypothetical protein
VFDFKALFLSIISDKVLMKDNNYIFNGNANVFTSAHTNNCASDYGDFCTGSWWKDTHELMCKGDKDILVPIMFFIDKVQIDSFGKVGLEPVTFCPCIFNEKTRRHSRAWRTLGFVNSFSYSTAQNQQIPSPVKMYNYHHCLRKVFESFIEVQKSGGLRCTIPYRGVLHDVVCKVPIIAIVGDCEGNDKLCGLFGSGGSRTRLVRDCHYKRLDDVVPTNYFCELCQMKDIKVMITDSAPDPETFKDMSYHRTFNAFWDAMFGANKDGGINQATPAECLHVIQIGINKYLVIEFVRRCSNFQKGKKKARLDDLVKIMSQICARQSDKDRPSLYFPHGITNSTKLTGKEWVGAMYVLFLVLCSKDSYDDYFHDQDEARKFRNVFERTLVLYKWITSSKIPRQDIRKNEQGKSKAQTRIREYMQILVDETPRLEGNGWKLPKVHSLHHIVQYIELYGVPNNTDGSRAESIAKDNAKEPAKKTRRQSHQIESQVGPKIVHKVLLDRSMEYVTKDVMNDSMCERMNKLVQDFTDDNDSSHITPSDNSDETEDNNNEEEEDIIDSPSSSKLRGSLITIQKYVHNDNPIQQQCTIFKSKDEKDAFGNLVYYSVHIGSKVKKSISDPDRHLFQYLIDNVLVSVSNRKLECYTEYIDEHADGTKTIFRTHPNYRNNGPWYDSAMVQFTVTSDSVDDYDDNESADSETVVDCVSILGLFIRVHEEVSIVDTAEILTPGDYCVFRSQRDYSEMKYYRPDSRRHPDHDKNVVERIIRGRNTEYCVGLNKTVSAFKMDPNKIYIQQTDTINHPCMVIPYELEGKKVYENSIVLLIRPWDDWGGLFIY